MDPVLLVARRGPVAILTLNRPEVRNALSPWLYAELEQAVRSLGEEARCLVLTGQGDAFCSGDDVKQTLGGGAGGAPPVADALAREPRLTPAADALLRCPVPVIAAVNGPAVGWGMELALMADLRVASERARFGELFVLRGLCCDVAGLARLAQLVGREKAAELLYTGAVIDAAEALRIGLVSRVAPHERVLDEAIALAERIAANPPLAVRALKAGLARALDPDWDDLGGWVASSLAALFRTEDHREGVRAFLEKRAPRFSGR
jgi:enoyl-CoA hydratase